MPNGRELVAYVTCDNGTVLFNLSDSESGMYELNSEGWLLFDGQLTTWQIDDLLETGRVAAAEVTSILTVTSGLLVEQRWVELLASALRIGLSAKA